MKVCKRCKFEKKEEEFSFVKNGTDKRKASCKKCHAADVRERYAKNPAPALRYAKESRKNPEVRVRINKKRNETRRQKPSLTLWRLAKLRARQKGLPFNIELEDVEVPSHCPIFGIELRWGCGKRQKDESPTVDRIIPSLGYVKGNVKVISWRANRIKSDATLQELGAVYRYVCDHTWP